MAARLVRGEDCVLQTVKTVCVSRTERARCERDRRQRYPNAVEKKRSWNDPKMYNKNIEV